MSLNGLIGEDDQGVNNQEEQEDDDEIESLSGKKSMKDIETRRTVINKDDENKYESDKRNNNDNNSNDNNNDNNNDNKNNNNRNRRNGPSNDVFNPNQVELRKSKVC